MTPQPNPNSQRPLNQFFGLLRVGRATAVKRISVQQSLQRELTEVFRNQAEEFLNDDTERIPFDPSFKCGEDHVFEIPDFELSEALSAATKFPTQCDCIALSPVPAIKSILSARHDQSTDTTTIYFQAFRTTRMLGAGGLSLLQTGNTFKKLSDAGFTLDTKLVAVFEAGTLLFRSFSAVNAFLDLKDYFTDATDSDVSAVLDHSLLCVEDSEKTLSMLDTTMRRRFAAIQISGILDNITARKSVNKAKDFDLALATRRHDGRDAIVFPSDKKTAKRFLTFLVEEYYFGVLTGRKLEASGHRSMST